MTIFKNSFEGGAAGASVGTAPGGGTPFTASDSTIVYTTDAAHGSFGATYNGASTSTGAVRWALSNESTVKLVIYKKLPSLPTVDYDLARLTYTGDATAAYARINSLGQLRLITTGGVNAWTASTAITAGSRYRYELYVTAGTSTTTGSARLLAYVGDSTTAAFDSGLITGTNTGGGAAFINARFGKLASGSYTGTDAFDDVAVYTGSDASQSPSPYVAPNQSPVVSAGPNQSVSTGTVCSLTGTASDPDGTIASTVWTFVSYPQASGSAPPLTGGTTLTPSFTPSQAGAYVLQLTVTDNAGAVTSDQVTVTGTASSPPTAAGTLNTGVAVIDATASTPGPGGTVTGWTIAPTTNTTQPADGVFLVTQPGTYVVTVTDSLGGSAQKTFVVTSTGSIAAYNGSLVSVTLPTPLDPTTADRWGDTIDTALMALEAGINQLVQYYNSQHV